MADNSTNKLKDADEEESTYIAISCVVALFAITFILITGCCTLITCLNGTSCNPFRLRRTSDGSMNLNHSRDSETLPSLPTVQEELEADPVSVVREGEGGIALKSFRMISNVECSNEIKEAEHNKPQDDVAENIQTENNSALLSVLELPLAGPSAEMPLPPNSPPTEQPASPEQSKCPLSIPVSINRSRIVLNFNFDQQTPIFEVAISSRGDATLPVHSPSYRTPPNGTVSLRRSLSKESLSSDSSTDKSFSIYSPRSSQLQCTASLEPSQPSEGISSSVFDSARTSSTPECDLDHDYDHDHDRTEPSVASTGYFSDPDLPIPFPLGHTSRLIYYRTVNPCLEDIDTADTNNNSDGRQSRDSDVATEPPMFYDPCSARNMQHRPSEDEPDDQDQPKTDADGFPMI